MEKNTSILILGIIVAVLAFLGGIPERWESIITITAGVLIAVLAYLLRRDEQLRREGGDTATYVQNDVQRPASSTDGIAHGYEQQKASPAATKYRDSE
jgi:hypothetical protein